MPAITPPNTFLDGAAADPEDFGQNLFEPSWTPKDSSVLNGRLDEDNLAGGTTLSYTDVRPGALSHGRTIGATANNDFFHEFFRDADTGVSGSTGDEGAVVDKLEDDMAISMFQAIPGTALTIELKQDVTALFLFWHLTVTVANGIVQGESGGNPTKFHPDVGTVGFTSNTGNHRTCVMLFVNGEPMWSVARRFKDGAFATLPPNESTNPTSVVGSLNNNGLNPDIRSWFGHVMLDATTTPDNSLLTAGLHNVDLRILTEGRVYPASAYTGTPPNWSGATQPSDNQTTQARVRVRKMGYIELG